MKCSEIDILGYTEGKGTKEARNHIEGCNKCTGEAGKLKRFINLISTQYAKGKHLEKELDEKLQSLKLSEMKKLPAQVAKKVGEVREKSLTAKLKRAIGKGGKSAKALFDNIMTPQLHAMPASPKDITKTKKKIKRKKKI